MYCVDGGNGWMDTEIKREIENKTARRRDLFVVYGNGLNGHSLWNRESPKIKTPH